MGNFYANVTLRTDETGAVAQTLGYLGRRAFVAPPLRGATVVYDEESELAGHEELARLAAELSRRHACPALAVLIADDDVLWYALYRAGRLDHDYDSNPSYDTGAPHVPPKGGNAGALVAAFGIPHQVAEVERVLRAPTGENGFIFEHERHAELVRLLGLPDIAVATGYEYIEDGELPEGLQEEDLRRVG